MHARGFADAWQTGAAFSALVSGLQLVLFVIPFTGLAVALVAVVHRCCRSLWSGANHAQADEGARPPRHEADELTGADRWLGGDNGDWRLDDLHPLDVWSAFGEGLEPERQT